MKRKKFNYEIMCENEERDVIKKKKKKNVHTMIKLNIRLKKKESKNINRVSQANSIIPNHYIINDISITYTYTYFDERKITVE